LRFAKLKGYLPGRLLDGPLPLGKMRMSGEKSLPRRNVLMTLLLDVFRPR
jgi:hypothetical protein